ncbi:hypothetical protein BRARA_F02257 [Brassica rapa]|uniref:Uncharacterized protein n=1 Tax=Brassica campestris TaxID=3711 RepID=A0A397YZX4_BRACM|nr:hypothetical protein BRARA_F02257 [Brassica rapa]
METDSFFKSLDSQSEVLLQVIRLCDSRLHLQQKVLDRVPLNFCWTTLKRTRACIFLLVLLKILTSVIYGELVRTKGCGDFTINVITKRIRIGKILV